MLQWCVLDRHGCLIACNNENFKTQPKCSSIDIQLTISRDIYPFKMITQFSFFETGKFSGHMAYQHGKKCMLCNKMYIMLQYIIKCVCVYLYTFSMSAYKMKKHSIASILISLDRNSLQKLLFFFYIYSYYLYFLS